MPTLNNGRASISDQVPVLDNTLNAYAPDSRVFACPSDNAHLATNTGTSYGWNNALNGLSAAHLYFMTNNGHSSQIPVLSDKQAFHPGLSSGMNILYADGHVSPDLVLGITP
jgi:prepilin-type processing-associated H-X9-DG protein